MIRIVLTLSVLALASCQTPKEWQAAYSVQGLLQLPYAEIKEPFAAYYDATVNMSRIDYYGGDVKTYQLASAGEAGRTYKIAYMTTESVLNQLSCFQVNGTSDAPVGIQSILPDLTGFKSVGSEQMNDMECDKLELEVMQGTKKNVYTMWLKKGTSIPVRYEMFGFDSLIGSHFDKYYLDYVNYSPKHPDSAVFKTPQGVTCGGFPGPGVEGRIENNPMAEYIAGDRRHHDHMFESFKKTHGKVYSGEHEHTERKVNFVHNVRFIQSTNRARKSYSVAVNHLADRSAKEMKLMNGRRYTPGYNGGQAFPHHDLLQAGDVPASMDWRLRGAVTPVKDQAVCGSCWSFGTAEVIEGQLFRKTGRRVRLSQQMLMDCSWGEGNNACDGGEDFRAYQWIMKHAANGGLATEADYGPYKGSDGKCRVGEVQGVAKLTGYVNVTAFDESALQLAIANVGPISVAIDASHKSLSFYAQGVYFEPKCGNQPDQLDHAVLAVGYGTQDGEDYWLVKNSWSTYWGMDGYVLMSRKQNNCGVATDATYPLL